MENGIKTIYLRKVKLLCDTRRVEQHTSIFDFCTLFGVYNLSGNHNPK